MPIRAARPPLPPALGSPAPWLIMGILNVTPDSFHDGSRYLEPQKAIARARQLAAEGAGVIDVGGESTRPGAEPVTAEEEMRRVIPVIEAIAAELPGTPISIDTSKAAVAAAALEAGAGMINDVTALRGDQEMAKVAAAAGCSLCLMHMLGEPRTMQKNPRYADVIADISAFFTQRVDFAVSRGVKRENIILDPGIGFGKTVEHNLEIIRRLGEFTALGLPVMIGASRKSFIGHVLGGKDTEERLFGTVAVNVVAFGKSAQVFRVHDVRENFEALRVADAIGGGDYERG